MVTSLPHNVEIERSILASCMLLKEDLLYFAETLKPENFYTGAHQLIFKATIDLCNADDPVELKSVAARLTAGGEIGKAGGASYLQSILDEPVATSAEYYAEQLIELSIKRDLIAAGYGMAKEACKPDKTSREALTEAEKIVMRLGNDGKKDRSIREIVIERIDNLEAVQRGDKQPGIMSGYFDLDLIISGFRPGALYIIGARPSMGKTALALNLAKNFADRGHYSCFFSLEMSFEELGERLLCMDAKINTACFRSGYKLGQDDWKRINISAEKISCMPLYVDDRPGQTYQELIRRGRRVVSKKGAEAIFIDYLQLVQGDKGNGRVEEISSISRNLKLMAKELNVPVICLSQLSRALETRDDKRPRLSDLRDSGAIEQDADAVLFLYRDEVYNAETVQKNVAEINVAKHRAGPTGNIGLQWQCQYQTFNNLVR